MLGFPLYTHYHRLTLQHYGSLVRINPELRSNMCGDVAFNCTLKLYIHVTMHRNRFLFK